VPRENRVPDAELKVRYKIIQDLITKGYRAVDLWTYIKAETDWQISRRQSFNYYKNAFEAFSDESEVNRPAYFALVLSRNEYLYQRALADKDLRLAASLVADLIRLLKLDTPNADFDWQSEAAKQGYDPAQIVERLKRLTAADDDNGEMVEAPEQDTANDNR